MGILQDVFARVPRLGRRRRFRNGYRYEEPRNKFRYTWLTVVVGCSVAGIALAATLFDPYSAFGRICSEILLPVWEWVCGAPVLVASWLAFGIAAATLVAVAAVAWRSGRLVCNTICPVGSTLSLVSRYALMHFDIDTDVCVNCGQCGRVCKANVSIWQTMWWMLRAAWYVSTVSIHAMRAPSDIPTAGSGFRCR